MEEIMAKNKSAKKPRNVTTTIRLDSF